MLKNKVAIVTGSTSGIGLGIAHGLVKRGVHVMLNGLRGSEQIEEVRAMMEKNFKTQVLFHGADMSKPDEIADLIKTTHEKLGSVDILVNNAGIQHVAPIDEFPPEKWEQIIAVNLMASFHTIRHTLPIMKAKGWGRIINIASAHALVASPYKSAYVTAKHGLAGLTKTVALEVAEQSITVNAICPGYVKTPLVENQIADTAKARHMTPEQVVRDVILGAEPTKHFTKISQIADMVAFLCSDSAENVTGSLMTIDGGWTAQ